MSNVYEMPNRIDPVDEASDWLACLDRGLTDDEKASLRAWLAAAPEHHAALMEAARLWDKMDTLSRLSDLFPRHETAVVRTPRYAVALAATVLLAVLAGAWLVSGVREELTGPTSVAESNNEQIFQTAVGEHSTVSLPDGSRLILNTNSRIRVTFSREQRLLILERGEVYVKVAHDPTRPLSVHAGGQIVEAVGTAFNLEITEDQHIELIVTEGRVLVGVAERAPDTTSGASDPPAPRAPQPKAVSAGERLLLGDSDEQVEPVAPEEIEVRLSWRGGNLVFRGESLEEALAEIERYTPVEFVIQDENLKKVRIVGLFKAGDVDGLLTTLRENFNIAYQRVNEEKVILTNTSTEM